MNAVQDGESQRRIRRVLGNIAEVDPRVSAVLSTFGDESLDCARRLDAAAGGGALFGQAVAVKDNICTDMGATTCGSKILENFHAPYNAHVVECLAGAGAVIVAKTNLDEFAMGSSTENSGTGPTKNPWNPDHVPGGSSGGSAAAVAARLVPYALGSDTGGSIRQPASFCGVTGLKPSYGRVSRYGLVAFGSSLDQIGSFAVDVEGVARVLGVVAGHDVRDSTSVDCPVPDYLGRLSEPVGAMRIGIAAEYLAKGLNDEVRRAVEAAIEVYRKLGADVQEIHLPHSKYVIACYYVICTAEASSNLARYDGVHYGHRTAHPKDYIDVYSSSRAEGFGAEVKRRIMLGTYALSSGYYDAYYLKALKVRTLIKNDFLQAFEHCDVILSPTTPTPAFRFGEKTEDPLEMYLGDVYNCAANLAGIPAISLPCGLSESGLPIGLQFMAPHFAEDRLLHIARQFQTATDFHTATPPICA